MRSQIDVVNGLQLLTAKPVTYLVNLSEKDYARKKNKWLPKIKAGVDEHNPGDPIIPFSVAFEERLSLLPEEEREQAQKDAGCESALGKITKAGYSSLRVSHARYLFVLWSNYLLAHPLLYVRSSRSARLDHPRRHEGAAGCRCHPLRLREQIRVR